MSDDLFTASDRRIVRAVVEFAPITDGTQEDAEAFIRDQLAISTGGWYETRTPGFSVPARIVEVAPPTEVHVLVVEHKHGAGVTVHRSRASAEAELWEYIEGQWDAEVGEQLGDLDDFMDGAYVEGWATEPRRDHDQIIGWYFDLVDDESYTITEAPIS